MQFLEEEIDKLQKERDQKLEEATNASVQHISNGSSRPTATPPTVNENNEVISPNVEYSPREGSEVFILTFITLH